MVRRIYLDANGSCPAMPEAKFKVLSSIDLIGNPSSSHDHGRLLRALIDDARQHVAKALGAHEKQVIFTSGASESNRLLVDALIKKATAALKPLNVLMSPFEHPSLLKPVMQASDFGHFSLKIMTLDDNGGLNPSPDDISRCDVLICCQAHNETGILPDMEALIAHAGPSTLVMSDISQGFSRLAPLSDRVDVMTFSAQKLGGFAGVGGAVFRGLAKDLPPPWVGGGQERGLRPGTESALLILALGEAARLVEESRKAHAKMKALRTYFEEQLAAKANIRVVGQGLPRLPNTSAICFLDENPDALRIACDMAGLSVGFGAACSGLAPEGSFALKRLGLGLAEEKATVRFSFAPDVTREDIDETIERLVGRVLR